MIDTALKIGLIIVAVPTGLALLTIITAALMKFVVCPILDWFFDL